MSSRTHIPKNLLPVPRLPLVDKMCSSCPFNHDRGEPKVTVPDADFEQFKLVAEISEFYCHETALEDPRTVVDGKGDPVGVQPHFKVCRGGWEHKLACLRDKLERMRAKR